MKAYDSNANASVEGGRTKERKGREPSEKERAEGWVVAAVNGARERGREKPRR